MHSSITYLVLKQLTARLRSVKQWHLAAPPAIRGLCKHHVLRTSCAGQRRRLFPAGCLRLSLCLSLRLSPRLSLCLSLCLSPRLSLCLSLCLSLRLSLHLSLRLSPAPRGPPELNHPAAISGGARSTPRTP